MSAEFIPPSGQTDPTLASRMQQVAANTRIGLGRAAAAGLLVITGGVTAFSVEAAAYPAAALKAAGRWTCSGEQTAAQSMRPGGTQGRALAHHS